MSYFDDASLVMIPSGYKDQKVYSVKPIDGSGDLTFSRASNATRVNSSGLVEKVRTNNALNSEDFTTWALAGTTAPTVSGNTTLSPIGTLTADTVSFSATSDSVVQQTSGVSTANQTQTVSVWAKVASGTAKFRFKCTHAGVVDYYSSDQTATTEWQRFSFTQSFGSGGTGVVYGILNEVAGGVKDVIFWGYQLEVGNDFGPTDYIATTSAAVSVGPVSGLPRLDYSGGCPSLLLEGQRTNLLTFSEQLTNAVWVPTSGVTMTANTNISPDGYQNADSASWGANDYLYYLYGPNTTGQTLTFSFYAKGTAGDVLVTRANTDLDPNQQINTILTGEWQRVTLTFNGGAYIYLYPFDSRQTGSTATSLQLWGAQLEEGAYATSYIPTLSSGVTRVADACYKAGISSLIGQTEGTVFLDTVINGNTNPILLQLIPNTVSYSSSIYVEYVRAINSIRTNFYDSGVLQASFVKAVTIGTRYKIAFAYKANDFVLYVDGVQIGTDTSGTVQSGLQDLFIGGLKGSLSAQDFNGNTLNQVLLFKTRLSNADLATLTTL